MELKSVLPYLVLLLYVLTRAVFVFSGDPATEQYLQVEGYDFHDRPKFTMNWRYALPNRSGIGVRRIVVRDKVLERTRCFHLFETSYLVLPINSYYRSVPWWDLVGKGCIFNLYG